MQISRKPYPIERILSAGTYFTAGGVGFVWLIIAAFLRKQVTPFLMYHILQSFFLSMGFFLFLVLLKFLYNVLSMIPVINILSTKIFLLFNMSIIYNLSLLQIFTSSVILYLGITAGLGFYSYLPWVSDIIKSNLPNR